MNYASFAQGAPPCTCFECRPDLYAGGRGAPVYVGQTAPAPPPAPEPKKNHLAGWLIAAAAVGGIIWLARARSKAEDEERAAETYEREILTDAAEREATLAAELTQLELTERAQRAAFAGSTFMRPPPLTPY